jgi:hypothetical protein
MLGSFLPQDCFLKKTKKTKKPSPVWWYIPTVPALGRLKQIMSLKPPWTSETLTQKAKTKKIK